VSINNGAQRCQFKSMYECRYLVAHVDVALLVQCIDPLNQSVCALPSMITGYL